MNLDTVSRIISTDKDPNLRIESFAAIDLRDVPAKLNPIVMQNNLYSKAWFPYDADSRPVLLSVIIHE